MSRPFKVGVTVPVRFSDTDAMGHVNNAAYFSYMEEGRLAYFKALFHDRDPREPAAIFPFIMADIQCAFKYPAFCGDIIRVCLGVTELKNTSFVMEYEITHADNGRLIATGRSVLVMYDYKTAKPVPLDPEFRRRVAGLEGREFTREAAPRSATS